MSSNCRVATLLAVANEWIDQCQIPISLQILEQQEQVKRVGAGKRYFDATIQSLKSPANTQAIRFELLSPGIDEVLVATGAWPGAVKFFTPRGCGPAT